MSESDDNNTAGGNNRTPSEDETDFEFVEMEEFEDDSGQPPTTDEQDSLAGDTDQVDSGSTLNEPGEDDFEDDDFGEDDFVEDDFEDDWADAPEQDHAANRSGKGTGIGNARSDLTTKLIIGGGVVLGLGVMYFQFFAGGSAPSQGGATGTPPQPASVQTQTKDQQQQDTSSQRETEQDQANQQQAQQQKTGNAQDEQTQGFMNNPDQFDTQAQSDQSTRSANTQQNTDTQQQNAAPQKQREQEDESASELPTPATISNQQSETQARQSARNNGIANKTDTPRDREDATATAPDTGQLKAPAKAQENQKQAGAELPGLGEDGESGDQDNSSSDMSSQERNQILENDRDQQKAQTQSQNGDRQKDKQARMGEQNGAAAAKALNKVNDRLSTVMDRLDTMEERIETIDTRTQQSSNEQDDAENEKIQALSEQIQQLEKKIQQSQQPDARQQTRNTSQGEDRQASNDQDSVAPANPPVSAITPKPRRSLDQQRTSDRERTQTGASAQWRLRSARPGLAYIVNSRGGPLKSVTTGDHVDGLGRITAIYQQNGRWIVQGTQGVLRQ